jgi:hypothetical protein
LARAEAVFELGALPKRSSNLRQDNRAKKAKDRPDPVYTGAVMMRKGCT